ncbi:ammonium transporter [Thermostilla marina]
MRRLGALATLVAAIALVIAAPVRGEEATTGGAGAVVSELEDAVASQTDADDIDAVAEDSEYNPADNVWLLLSSALVLMMTAPGLAMFYSGLVRRKNVLSVMMQCVFLMAMMTVVWALWGYTLSFGGSGAWIGDASYVFMQNTGPQAVGNTVAYPLFPGLSVPVLTHMLFQGMFFIITPALICGAFAERMKFSAMVLFCLFWGTVVYAPLCHWVWGGGILQYGSDYAVAGGALDFAGGTVVHISSGVSALVCALLIGKRLGYGSEPMPPHNMTYTALGTALLWVGWFGFNAGSALAATESASLAFCTTHFAAAAGGLAWALIEWIRDKKPTLLGTCSGVVAGLVCITPAAGFVMPISAIIMGAAAGIVCYFSVAVIKPKFGYDDSLDAFGVHGVGGTLGAILTGVFATRLALGDVDSPALGMIEGGSLIVGQIIAVVISIAFAGVVSFVGLKIIDALVGLRVGKEEEILGLDISQHGEEGYIYN